VPKNDTTHKGNRIHLRVADLEDKNQVYCITAKLWEFEKGSCPVRGRSVFFIPAINWTLKPRYFNVYLKQLAVAMGLDPRRISSHSALAAAGMPNYVIMNMGRWRSLALSGKV
jgi:hypothetical protein